MLKLHHIFFYNFLGIFFLSFILETIVAYYFLKDMEIKQTEYTLKTALNISEQQLQNNTNYDTLVQTLHNVTQLRYTLIADDGAIIAESNHDKHTMDNHLHRPEIQTALTSPYGSSVRYSKSINRDYMYLAKQITLKKKSYFLRISVALSHINESFYASWIQISLLFAFVIIIAFFIAYKMSQKVEEDVQKLMHYLKEVANKNYKAPLRITFSREFAQIATTLKRVISKLDQREKQKRKYTARLRLINKQRNDLLSAISHEFKNPLAAIQGYAQTLQNEELSKENEPIYAKFLDKIVVNSEKITTMIDRIALSVKLENKDLAPVLEPCDLNVVAHDAIATIKKKYPHRVIHINAKEVVIQADRTMMEMVIINLLDNALKYSSGDVYLKLTKRQLVVTDSGIGIAKEDLDKINTKFYRVDKNSWDNSMGLGLAIVNYILTMHNMDLSIKSTPTQGSSFYFTFGK